MASVYCLQHSEWVFLLAERGASLSQQVCWVPYQPSLLHLAQVHLYLALSLGTAAGTGVKSTHPLTEQEGVL